MDADNGVTRKLVTSSASYSCEFCHRVVSSKKSLERHKTLHVNSYSNKCNICKKSYPTGEALLKHYVQKSHVRKQNILNMQAVSLYMPSKAIKHNLNTIISSKADDNKSTAASKFGTQKNFACEYCTQRFRTPVRLRHHHMYHGILPTYPCDLCHIRFQDIQIMEAHRETHNGRVPDWCNTCDKYFDNEKLFKKHQLKHEKERLKRRMCPICNKEIGSEYLIQKHIQRVHSSVN